MVLVLVTSKIYAASAPAGAAALFCLFPLYPAALTFQRCDAQRCAPARCSAMGLGLGSAPGQRQSVCLPAPQSVLASQRKPLVDHTAPEAQTL